MLFEDLRYTQAWLMTFPRETVVHNKQADYSHYLPKFIIDYKSLTIYARKCLDTTTLLKYIQYV